MHTHPVFLRLEGRPCVVIGGDAAAAAKALACLAAGALVTVVAERLSEELAGRVRHLARDYRPGDLAGADLAYASSRDPERIRALAAEARRERVWLNVIDVPEACDFLSPAVVERGDLKIAVGTGGASPGLAARLRRALEAAVGPEYEPFVAILGAVRARVAPQARSRVIEDLLDSRLLELVRDGRRAEIDALLARVAGVSLEGLGVALEERV
jgi:siroheme synthase-like protein